MSPARSMPRICDISSTLSTPPIWHITLPPVPAISQARMARVNGSRPWLAITFCDMRTLMPMAMSAFSASVFAAASVWAKSMLNSSPTGKADRPMLAMCTKAKSRVRDRSAMARRTRAKALAPASPADTAVVVPW